MRTLRLTVAHRRGDMGFSGSEHVRIVVVARAPALFIVPCGDESCRDGGHEITWDVLRALRAGSTTFDGEDSCRGTLGTAAASCASSIRYRGEAGYG